MAKRRRRPAWGKILAIVLVIAALAAAWRYTPLHDYITGPRLVEWAKAIREHPASAILLVLAYVPTAFVMLPRPVLTLIGVIAFGPWIGFAYAMAGVMLSALVTYYIGRFVRPERVKRIAGDHFDRVRQLLAEHGFAAMFAIRVAPLAPFIVGSVLAGAARTNVFHYSAATVLGMAPGLLATSVFGSEISSALQGRSDISYIAIGVAIVALAAVTWFAARWLKRQTS